MDVKVGPVRLYSHHLGDYMRRWILLTPLGTVRLHNIRRPDADPDMHDHPWNFVSLIIRGGYTEEVPVVNTGAYLAAPHVQCLDYRAGAVNVRLATDAHRIVDVLPDTWTLVISGTKLRSWGFWTRDGFVPWREYLERQSVKDVGGYAEMVERVSV